MDDLELIFLGSGTSAGVPVIGCDCATCRSKDPRDRRTRPSVCLRFGDATGQERVILVDTSPDLREQVLRHDLRRCDAILFTHFHVDHTFGLDDVRRFNAVMRQSIPIFAEEATLQFLERTYEHVFQPHRNVNVSFVASLEPNTIRELAPFDLFGLRFTPLRFYHGKLPIVGFRIEALDEEGEIAGTQPSILPLAYCTDVSRIPDDVWPQLEGLDTLVLDMLRPSPHPTHFSTDEAVEAARRIDARNTWFIHMTHDIRHADLDAELPDRMALSHDGLVLRR